MLKHTMIICLDKQRLTTRQRTFSDLMVNIADSLLKWLSKRGVYAQGYADDGVILVIGIVLSTVCEIMQRAVKAIEEWRTSYQLAVSPTKTEMALFTRR